MIQRIQSLYLLIAAICQVAFACVAAGGCAQTALCWFTQPDARLAMLPVLLLVLVALVCEVVAFVQFKNRRRQMSLCSVAKWTQFLGILWTGYVLLATNRVPASSTNVIALALLVLALLMVILARHAIKKDEDLVRAADRIR